MTPHTGGYPTPTFDAVVGGVGVDRDELRRAQREHEQWLAALSRSLLDHDELRLRGIVHGSPLLGTTALTSLQGRRYDPEHPDALLRHLPGKHNQLTHGRPGVKGLANKAVRKGKDLLASGVSALADDALKRAGQVPSGDGALLAIAERQGFAGPPRVVSRAQMDEMIQSGQPELLRGVKGIAGKSAADINEELRSGAAYYGNGIFGNGIYFGRPGEESASANALGFADGSPGSVARATLSPTARIISVEQISAEHYTWFKESASVGAQRDVFSDLGRYAAARGYDAIDVGSPPQIVVLNRTALVIEAGGP